MIDRHDLTIRESDSRDLDGIRAIHQSAFPVAERDSVSRLAIELARTPSESALLSLLAEHGDRAVGHVAFSPLRIDGAERLDGSILAPLAVQPDAQRSGIGTALVRAGLERLEAGGVTLVLVYGDPDYYGRFGFEPGLGERFIAPHPLQYPFGWQAVTLGEPPALPETPVRVLCVDALDDPAMW
jgi:putative acetyltransferase